MKKRLFFIQIMRVICCIGVFTGHFLGKALPSAMSNSFLTWLRHGFMSRTIFSYCWQGDNNVVVFLVLGGFLVTYVNNESRVRFRPERLIKKMCYVFIPALIVLLLSIGIHFSVHMMGYNSLFDIGEIYSDLRNLALGGGIHYSYQLWYIPSMMTCYVFSYVYIAVSADSKYIRYALYPLFFLWAYEKYGYCLSVYIIGMICGEIGNYVARKKIRYSKSGAAIGIIALLVSPFLCNQQHLDLNNKVMLAVAISIFILGMLIAGKGFTDNENRTVDWLDKSNFAFYLLHVIFIDVISSNIYLLGMTMSGEKIGGKTETAIILIDYIVSLAAIWWLADLYEKYIIRNAMKLCEKIIVRIKKFI